MELLVAMVILVMAFGLVTYLYTKAAKIRRTVVINSEIQQVLSEMADTLAHGEKDTWGLMDATGLDDSGVPETSFVARNGTQTMRAEIVEVDEIQTLRITRNTVPPVYACR